MTFSGSITRKAFAAFLLFAASPVRAEEAEGGLPQFDVSAFPAQLFWLAVCFAALYVMMTLMVVPRFQSTQDNRKKVIAAEIEAAREAHDSARHTVAELEKSLGKARAEAIDHVNDMVAEVNEESAAHQLTQEKELQRKMNRVEADIAVAREDALKSIHANAVELASVIAEKVAGTKLRIMP